MGGQFNNKNAGKRGLSLNVRHPEGLQIARRLIAMSDIVAEGFSPGVLDRWGLGYDELRRIKPDIIYAQQSGMGTAGRYGRLRAVGPVAAALSGVSEMSGLPEPAMPAGWGYSYLDWIGAYSFATAMLAALYHRDRTGDGPVDRRVPDRVGHLHQRRGDPRVVGHRPRARSGPATTRRSGPPPRTPSTAAPARTGGSPSPAPPTPSGRRWPP